MTACDWRHTGAPCTRRQVSVTTIVSVLLLARSRRRVLATMPVAEVSESSPGHLLPRSRSSALSSRTWAVPRQLTHTPCSAAPPRFHLRRRQRTLAPSGFLVSTSRRTPTSATPTARIPPPLPRDDSVGQGMTLWAVDPRAPSGVALVRPGLPASSSPRRRSDGANRHRRGTSHFVANQ
jgi:hypothetical protein